jgi:hypothetical protein
MCEKGSFSLKIEDPWWETLGADDHSASAWEFWLAVVLDLEVGHLAWVEWAWQLGGEGEVGVVEADSEVALLVEWVLEVHGGWLGSSWALNWSLWLWSSRLTEQEARVFHSFWTCQLDDSSAITNSEWLILDINADF